MSSTVSSVLLFECPKGSKSAHSDVTVNFWAAVAAKPSADLSARTLAWWTLESTTFRADESRKKPQGPEIVRTQNETSSPKQDHAVSWTIQAFLLL